MTTLSTLKSIAVRSQHTIVADCIGGVSLIVMLVVGLHLPSFI